MIGEPEVGTGRQEQAQDSRRHAKSPSFTAGRTVEAPVDEEVFNLELRKFLKRFGVTAQREIEKAVETALQERKLAGSEVLAVKATLTIPGILPTLDINGEIALGSTSAG
jgi:hypothetical protein